MKRGKYQGKLVFIGLLLLLATFLGCTQGSNEDIFWVVDSQGMFHTSDLERAQQEIPFTITVPTYLPNDLDPDSPYEIGGPLKDSSQNENIEVWISYRAGGERIIEIEENSQTIIMLPNPDANPIYLDISGIQVLQQEECLYGGTTIEGLRFDWNQGGLTFSVLVFSYSQDEAIKIVESMIEQIE
jgi:hypothetical protein